MSAETAQDFDAGTPPPAVILAAGQGWRLARREDEAPKPARSLLGLSLAERTLSSCMAAGIQRFVVVLGHLADEVRAHFEKIAAKRGCDVEFVTAPDWQLGNGASALVASKKVGAATFLLTMVDHLLDPALIHRVLRTRPKQGEVCLGVDRRKAAIFDPDDVTKVGLSNDRVSRIGKTLAEWDAADTGVFLCTRALFEGLKRARAKNRHSLSDGIAELAASGHVRAVDVSGESWLDVDTPAAHQEARRRLLASLTKGGEDGYVSARLNRPVSTRLSARLAGTGITPNQITLLSFAISLVGAALFARGQHLAGVLGGLLVQISSVLDGCDGEIARLKHLTTPRGAWLDTLLDRYSDLLIALAVTFAYAAAHPGPLPWLAGFIAVCGFTLASYVTKEFALRLGRPYPNDVLNRLKRRDLRLLVICLGAVINRPFEALLAVGALAHACVLGVLIRGWLGSKAVPSR